MAASKRVALLLLGVGVFVPASVCRADGYSLGSIQGQNSWSGGSVPILTDIDQSITNAAAHTGTQSWHISNSSINGFTETGVYGGMPHSPNLAVPAGQPSSEATADTFQMTFWFKPASTSTAGDGSWLQLDIGQANGDDRTNFFGIKNLADGSGGLQLREAESVNTPDQFLNTQTIASGIDRTSWHQLVITGHYLNGDGNDYFTVSLDGSLLTNPDTTDPSPNAGTNNFFTFEGYWNQVPLPYEQAGRIFFAPSALGSAYGYSNTAPQGYYIDDLTYETFNSSTPTDILSSFDSNSFEAPEPASLVLIAAGGLCMISRRRRNKN